MSGEIAGPGRSWPGLGEVQCIMGNGHMGPPFPCEQTDMTKNITFPQFLGGR